jgi:hypothetical protein
MGSFGGAPDQRKAPQARHRPLRRAMQVCGRESLLWASVAF